MIIQSLQSAPTQGTDCTLPASSELVDIFNVPRGKKERITARIKFVRGPFGADATLTIESEDSKIMTTVDPETDQAGVVLLKVKKGDDLSSPFIIEGITIDKARLDVGKVIDIKNPDDPEDDVTYPGNFVDVVVWDFEDEEIVDYNAMDGGSEVICYNDQNSPALKSDMASRTNCGGFKPDAVAADGASLQLARVKAGGFGKFCFTILHGNVPVLTQQAYSGKFSDPIAGGASTTSPATNVDAVSYQSPVEPGVRYWGFGTYTPPSDFFEENQEERKVAVEVQFMAQHGPGIPTRSHITAVRREITIRRAPVLLVHGVWSNSCTWGAAFQRAEGEGGWLVDFTFSYDGPRDCQVDQVGSEGPFTAGVEQLQQRIDSLIVDSRTSAPKTATTKVDIVAHSMGGLLARSGFNYANPNNPEDSYRSAKNFQRGGVRKLITLHTPHFGSQIANLLINLHYTFGHDDGSVNKVERKLPGDIHQGAICQLAENNPALGLDAAPDVRAFAFEGTGGDPNGLTGKLQAIPFLFPLSANTHIYPYVFSNLPNDGLVAFDSQRGGLPFQNNPLLTHSPPFSQPHPTSDAATAQQVFSMLDRSQMFSAGIPAGVTDGNGVPRQGVGLGADIDARNFSAQCTPGPGNTEMFRRPP